MLKYLLNMPLCKKFQLCTYFEEKYSDLSSYLWTIRRNLYDFHKWLNISSWTTNQLISPFHSTQYKTPQALVWLALIRNENPAEWQNHFSVLAVISALKSQPWLPRLKIMCLQHRSLLACCRCPWQFLLKSFHWLDVGVSVRIEMGIPMSNIISLY